MHLRQIAGFVIGMLTIRSATQQTTEIDVTGGTVQNVLSDARIDPLIHALTAGAQLPQWRHPYQKDEPNVFYYTFNPPVGGQLAKESAVVDKKTQDLFRGICDQLSSYANVQLIELGKEDFDALGDDGYKFALIAHSKVPGPLAFEEYYQEAVIKNQEFNVRPISAIIQTFTHVKEPDVLLPVADNDLSTAVDTKTIFLPSNLRKHTSDSYTQKILLHELLHVFGLEHPCANIIGKMLADGVIQQNNVDSSVDRCIREVAPQTIMEAGPPTNIASCIVEEMGTNHFHLPMDKQKIKKAFMTCLYDEDKDPVKAVDKKALELLFGSIQSRTTHVERYQGSMCESSQTEKNR